MLRIVAISDTHNRHDQLTLPPGDVLIHAGDFSAHGLAEDLERFVAWLEAQPHRHKLVIAGNHDWICQRSEEFTRQALRGVTYLSDEGCELEGLKFWGAPWQPEFGRWAFNLPRGPALAEKWALIPDDTDVLITHGPAYGHGDKAPGATRASSGRAVGCLDLLDRIRVVQPRLHVFGHIHCGYGVTTSDALPTKFVNASTCTEDYEPTQAPVVVDLY
jgi:predicted phosphodiesterase